MAHPKGSKVAEENKKAKAGKLTGEHTTKPIEESAMIRKWFAIAKEHDEHYHQGCSWYLLLLLGFNTGLRISDLIKLTVNDVRGREFIILLEEKTDKERRILIRRDVGKILDTQLKNRRGEEFVLSSRQYDLASGYPKAISRQRAYGIVKTIADRAGYTEHVGCHTMRKTYAWSLFDASGRDINLVQKALNHSSQSVTMHYIGIDQKEIEDVTRKMRPMY